MKKETQSYR